MTPEEITKMQNDLKAANDRAAALEEENKKLKTPPEKKEEEVEDPLLDKSRKDKEAKDKRAAETKSLENAVKFNLNINEFVKENSDLLPEEITGILKTSEGKTFDSENGRDSRGRSGVLLLGASEPG
jgi:predicted  nucleic acid-binding Zn-ribbon protein